MEQGITALNEYVKQESAFAQKILRQAGKVIVGQHHLLERLLVGLLADGHVLLEGVPGLAKTLAVKTLAGTIQARFQRIQFTPDLLPADLVGTLVFDPATNQFHTKKGPIFANFILADEINRAPAKVQSALLEAMQERQVTIGETTFPLDLPFLVLATQNPIEQEGTYPLPEAQVDRFMLKVCVGYPSRSEELQILDAMAKTQPDLTVEPVVSPEEVLHARKVVDQIYLDDKLKEYIVNLVLATRAPGDFNIRIEGMIQYGASPRATINLALAAKAYAFIQGRGYVTPQDVKSIGLEVLQHRIVPSFEAEAEEKTSADLVQQIFAEVEVP
ncbi:MAG: MoxR family ATPase [Verrucomicrobiota bacterium]|jgi:MoxR-like ATPase|nr:MoxR family ATPase [Verrucomicrobiota bacterium]MDD8046277.1 MoxR family ATPase [Verrucomicrobiota bacterium]MDD8052160.1 MoxR family ATPase [Verrucomicrobiota bacterium]HCF95769.1 ATPase [Verrucomicrobiota bacterium]